MTTVIDFSMAEVGVFPHPNGVVPNFVNPPDQRELQIAVHSISLTLMTIFVALRFYTRHFITRRLASDDCKSFLEFVAGIIVNSLRALCSSLCET